MSKQEIEDVLLTVFFSSICFSLCKKNSNKTRVWFWKTKVDETETVDAFLYDKLKDRTSVSFISNPGGVHYSIRKNEIEQFQTQKLLRSTFSDSDNVKQDSLLVYLIDHHTGSNTCVQVFFFFAKLFKKNKKTTKQTMKTFEITTNR